MHYYSFSLPLKMNIDDLQAFITNQLNKSYQINHNDLKHSKNPSQGDFLIFTPHNLESLKIKYIKSIQRCNKMIQITIDKKEIAHNILCQVFFPKKQEINKTVLIDFSSPNIAKKFHPGHLRTTILGNFVNNILCMKGYKTIKLNYLGDWGKQFGLLGIGYEKYGDEELLAIDPIKHLYEIYVKINNEKETDERVDDEAKKWFTELENGNEKNVGLWRKFRELSIQKYMELYKILNCSFDVYSGESFFASKGKEFLDKWDVFTKGEDNSIYADTSHGKLCVLKQDGSTLYSTRDLASATDRLETFKPDLLVYVVASQQDLYFKQLFELLKKTIGGEYLHISYGMVNGMSTRKGTVVFLEDIINEAKSVMLEKMKRNIEKFNLIGDVDKTCEILAVSAIIVQDFSAKRIKNYTFDINQCTEINGFTGPYLQYCHCRLKSIEEKNLNLYNEISESLEKGFKAVCPGFDVELLNDKCLDILFMLYKYSYVIDKSAENFEPSTIITYLMDLCKQINGIVSDVRVMGVDYELGKTRLIFFMACRRVINSGICLLGMTPLDRM